MPAGDTHCGRPRFTCRSSGEARLRRRGRAAKNARSEARRLHADPPALPLSQPAFAAVPDLPMSRLRVRCRRARSSLTPRTIFVTKRARRVRTHARARARHAFRRSGVRLFKLRPLSPPRAPTRCATALPPAPRPHRRPASASAPQPAAAPSSTLFHTSTHLRAAPRRAGPRRRGCAPRSGATGRVGSPAAPQPWNVSGAQVHAPDVRAPPGWASATCRLSRWAGV